MQRLSFIDSAKGLCILLVVAMHLGIPELFPGAYDVMVPTFFFLSGYFYSVSNGFKALFLKKMKQLVVPFSFFYLLSYSLYYLLILIYAPIKDIYNGSILDCFIQKQYFNGPLWFLPCLFWVSLMAYPIYKYLYKLNIIRIACFTLVGILGYSLSKREIFLPLALDTALTALPFFCFGREIKRACLFEKIPICISLILVVITYIPYMLFPASIWMAINKYSTYSFIHLYLVLIPFVLSIVLLCKILENHKINFSFFGRITMVILCTHHLFYRPIRIVLQQFISFNWEPYINFILTVFSCYLVSLILSKKNMIFLIGK